jgi:hypothetical protein
MAGMANAQMRGMDRNDDDEHGADDHQTQSTSPIDVGDVQ